MQAQSFFHLPRSLGSFASFFPAEVPPWEWLKVIGAALAGQTLGGAATTAKIPPGVHIEGAVFIHPTVKLPPYATIIGPASSLKIATAMTPTLRALPLRPA